MVIYEVEYEVQDRVLGEVTQLYCDQGLYMLDKDHVLYKLAAIGGKRYEVDNSKLLNLMVALEDMKAEINLPEE